MNAQGIKFSRDGSTVAFHAAIKDFDGERTIYITKNIGADSKAVPLSINNK